jgi:hypothetical protein
VKSLRYNFFWITPGKCVIFAAGALLSDHFYKTKPVFSPPAEFSFKIINSIGAYADHGALFAVCFF